MHSPNDRFLSTTKTAETAILVAVITPLQPSKKTEEYVTELAFLAKTWGIEVIQTFTQKIQYPHHATFIGRGKVEEVALFVSTHNITYVIFDDELSPSQVRNLERQVGCRVLDRSLLIFNIFSMRAQTKQAKTQIELAQYQYLLPRLTRMWTHLSRQKGGSAGMRGPGEKELETDKRIVQNKIAQLRTQLMVIDRQCSTRRKGREPFIQVALVGYTNVGKSTLMNVLTQAGLLSENKLFATLDATTRKLVLNHQAFLLTDTVGFIRKLPHTLVASFKSTLDEIKNADLLIHVVDGSYCNMEEQVKVVNDTLYEIGIRDKPTMMVINKIDQLKSEASLLAMQKTWQHLPRQELVCISATDHIHIDLLKHKLVKMIKKLQIKR